MKKIIATIILLIGSLVPLAAGASAYHLSAKYQAVYCYPTGSYWAKQRAAFPAYYAANNAYYTSNYGAGTIYCP